ncbi:hypothetical protein G6F33_013458 [Rhizopus arrhizus]|nr:hypothetical protein G6F33_013458 [Rhizopus arrhizus]
MNVHFASCVDTTPASCRRSTPAVLTPLGLTFSQQLGEYRRSTRLQNTFSHATISLNRLHPSPTPIVQRPTTPIGPSHSRPTHQTGDRTCAPPSIVSRFCKPHVHYLEEDRRLSTSVQSAHTESICRLPSLQDGNHPAGLSYGTTWRLHDINRFIRCLSSPSSPPRTSTLSAFPLERLGLPVQDDTLRSVYRALLVYQNNQAHLRVGSSARQKPKL